MDVLLRTGRLTLRRFTPADAGTLFALDADPEVVRHTGRRYRGGGTSAELTSIERDILPGFIARYARDGVFAYWAADDRETGETLGWFQFTPAGGPGEVELGYRLKRSAWGRGLATEGARALLDRGFRDWGVERVVASALVANRASIRVLERLGLRRVRLFHHEPRGPGEPGGPAAEYAVGKSDHLRGQDREQPAPAGSRRRP